MRQSGKTTHLLDLAHAEIADVIIVCINQIEADRVRLLVNDHCGVCQDRLLNRRIRTHSVQQPYSVSESTWESP